MKNSDCTTTRRELVMGTAATLAASKALAQSTTTVLTAGQVIDRIKSNVGVPWREQTVDRIIGGSADTPVKGIATTMMATLDVLMRANAAGKNMVITHEPTYFTHQDTTDNLTNDPVYQFKRDYIDKNQMIVFHFHDHWHARKPDGIATGMLRELGWESRLADPSNPRKFQFDSVPLAALANEMRSKLRINVMRVVGDPALKVRRATASWGYCSLFPGIPLLANADTDLLIVGETREWEVVEYAQDAIASGQKKALVMLGHVVSEQAGMKYCAEWLKPLVKEVPVEFVAATEPYWSPSASKA